MLLALPFGLAIGLALGMLGGGGSILVVPVLTYALGQSAQEAATASLVIVTIAAIAGGAGQARHHNVCWHHAALFTAAALPGIVAGTAVGDAVSGRLLLGSFAVVMLLAAYATVHKQGVRGGASASASRCPALRPRWDLGFGALVGFLTGFLGIGGGFVVVPALVVALHFPMRSAIGTSLAIITATGVLGAAVHFSAGRTIDAELTVAMTAAMVLGALAGARAGQRVSEPALARGFAGLVTAVAAYVLVMSAFLGGPPAG
jgi:uncharacterized protein